MLVMVFTSSPLQASPGIQVAALNHSEWSPSRITVVWTATDRSPLTR